MAGYCGQAFRVRAMLNRLYVEGDSVRGIADVVLLDDVRCDGTAHANCARACHLLWKTAWLQPADAPRAARELASEPPPPTAATCQGVGDVLREATYPLPWWQPAQYWRDLRGGTFTLAGLVHLVGAWLGKQARWYLGRFVRRRWRSGSSTPVPPLSLQPGELVEVRCRAEIAATLDERGKNRGMGFTQGMWGYCGQRFRVRARVEQFIDETSGRMCRVTDTVTLEDALCEGHLFRGCPRACHWFWREAWLKRVGE
jgi:hypothetical protein